MSNAGSDELGRFLAGDEPEEVNIEQNTNARSNRAAVFSTGGPRRVRRPLQMRQPPTQNFDIDPPFRIHTQRPINLRLAPPQDHSELIDSPRQSGREQPAVKVFSRSEVRGIVLPKPPSSQLSGVSGIAGTNPNASALAAMRWRLRGYLNDNASITSFRNQESESDRFSLGSYKTQGTGARSVADSALEDTVVGLRRALDSRYVPDLIPGRKRLRTTDGNERTGRQSTRRLQGAERNSRADSNLREAKEKDIGDQERAGSVDGSLDLGYGGDDDIGNGDVNDVSDSGAERSQDDAPSRLDSENAQEFENGPRDGAENGLFVRDGVSEQNLHEDLPADFAAEQARSVSVEGIRPRPRDPHEIEVPLIFEVPVAEIPAIDWDADDIDVDGQYLQQQLEYSESESEEESDAGSVAEMIDYDSDEDETFGEDNNKEWVPDAKELERTRRDGGENESDSDSEDDGVEALTESEDDENRALGTDTEVTETVESARRARPKRHRIPTVKYWLGERIEYEADGKLGLLTAVDVRRVDIPQRTYRKRRPYRRRRQLEQVIPVDDVEAEVEPRDVQVPVFDTISKEWRDRTVARSINGLEFSPLEAEDGSILPLVSRCMLFGGKSDSAALRLYVMRIEPGGVFSYTAEQNKASTFVVWRGKCTVHLNNHVFDLLKGMACVIPRGNDFFLDNGSTERLSTGDVYLFVTEVNAQTNPDLADAMTRDAHSMISGAAALSNFFESEESSDNMPPRVAEGERSPIASEIHAEQHDPDDKNVYEGNSEMDDNVDNGSGGLAFEETEPTDTFVPSYARAVRSHDGISMTRPEQAGGHRQPLRAVTHDPRNARNASDSESLDSLSLALGSDRGRQLDAQNRRDQILARPAAATTRIPSGLRPPTMADGTDSIGMLSDYLEGRKGDPNRVVLRERPILNSAELRIRTYLREVETTRNSDFSHGSE